MTKVSVVQMWRIPSCLYASIEVVCCCCLRVILTWPESSVDGQRGEVQRVRAGRVLEIEKVRCV